MDTKSILTTNGSHFVNKEAQEIFERLHENNWVAMDCITLIQASERDDVDIHKFASPIFFDKFLPEQLEACLRHNSDLFDKLMKIVADDEQFQFTFSGRVEDRVDVPRI